MRTLLGLFLAGCAWAQTALITPVQVLPLVDHSAAGSLSIRKADDSGDLNIFDGTGLTLDAATLFKLGTTFTLSSTNALMDAEIRLVARGGGLGGNYIGFKAPTTIAGNTVWELPNTDGSMGDVLTTNGSKVLSWTAGGGGGSSPPFVDTTEIIKGSGDATKRVRFEVDGLTTATTRTLTPQDANYTVAGLETAQVFTANQTMYKHLILAEDDIPFDPATGWWWEFPSPTTIYFRNAATAIMEEWQCGFGQPCTHTLFMREFQRIATPRFYSGLIRDDGPVLTLTNLDATGLSGTLFISTPGSNAGEVGFSNASSTKAYAGHMIFGSVTTTGGVPVDILYQDSVIAEFDADLTLTGSLFNLNTTSTGRITGGNFNAVPGAGQRYQVGGVTIIDSGLNLVNVGNLSMGGAISFAADATTTIGTSAGRTGLIETSQLVARTASGGNRKCFISGGALSCTDGTPSTTFNAASLTGQITSAALAGSGIRCLQSDNSGNITLGSGGCGLVTSVGGVGAGINVTPATGVVTIQNTGVTGAVGTPNQVGVSTATGAVTFSTPQDIATSSSPTFSSLALTGNLTLSGNEGFPADNTSSVGTSSSRAANVETALLNVRSGSGSLRRFQISGGSLIGTDGGGTIHIQLDDLTGNITTTSMSGGGTQQVCVTNTGLLYAHAVGSC